MLRYSPPEGQAALLAESYAAFHLLYPTRSFYSWYGYRRAANHPLPWGTPHVRQETITFPPKVEGLSPGSVLVALQQLQHALAAKTQRSAVVTIETNLPIGVAFLSDLHIGNIQTRHDLIERDIERIAACPGLYCVMGGDLVDNFASSPKLAHVAREDLIPPQTQWQLAAYFLGLLGPKLLARGSGNHDQWSERQSGIDPALLFYKDLPAIDTKEGGLLTLQVGTQPYLIARKHTPRGGSGFNPTHAVKRWYDTCPWQFDVGVMEHQHNPTFEPFVRHGKERLAIRTGTYKPHDRYAIELGLYDSELAVPTVIFDPHERKMLPYKHLDDALVHLDSLTR